MLNKLIEFKTTGGGENLAEVLEISSDGKVFWKESEKELNAELNEAQITALTKLADQAHDARVANRNLIPEAANCEIPVFEVFYQDKKLFESCGSVPDACEDLMSALEEIVESCREYA